MIFLCLDGSVEESWNHVPIIVVSTQRDPSSSHSNEVARDAILSYSAHVNVRIVPKTELSFACAPSRRLNEANEVFSVVRK